jgi:Zn-dependent protease
MPTDVIFWLLVLGISVILHEVAHGYMANWLGDPTARIRGRLTLNPLVHIDPMGTFILPLFLYLTGSAFLVGYAKPVPYNPFNIKYKNGEALVAFAGPATNILLALIFGLSIRFFGNDMSQSLLQAFTVIASLNLFLSVFNLLPVPPLDGSKVLSALLPGEFRRGYDSLRHGFERLGFIGSTLILLVIFYFFSSLFAGFVAQLFSLLTGLPQ